MVLQYILGKPKAESKQENCDKDTRALEHIPSVRKRTADSRGGRSGQGGRYNWAELTEPGWSFQFALPCSGGCHWVWSWTREHSEYGSMGRWMGIHSVVSNSLWPLGL